MNLIILLVVTFSITFIGLNISGKSVIVEEIDCIEVNKVASFVYDTCYDTLVKTIFINVERSPDNYNLDSFEFSFFDFDQQFYRVKNVPDVGGKGYYKIPADKNPDTLDIRMKIISDFSSPVCEEPRTLLIKDCPIRPGETDAGVGISPFVGVAPDEFLEIEQEDVYQDSDLFTMSLFDKVAVWENECKSNWDCSEWESCVGGIQHRTCEDVKKCYVPINKPETVKYCDGKCREDWECSWSQCSDGFTMPDCRDLNNCGTTYELPQKLACGDDKKQCVPDVVCNDWTNCEVNYNFVDLVGISISDLSGSKSRICIDRNKCSDPQEEVQECSVNVDIYTKRFIKCGEEYMGVYNKLNNDLIARVDIGDKESSYLNLYLDDKITNEYCDYCFNGIRDGDESEIDCGGGCMSCSEKYTPIDFKKKSWFEKLFG